jgi:pyruvate/2-oxoglutarate/acetoin dehydrogenase E1 component
MKKRAFDVETLDDYDIERIADKIEKTGRIAVAVDHAVQEEIRTVANLLQNQIEKVVERKVKQAQNGSSSNEAMLKIVKYILEEIVE